MPIANRCLRAGGAVLLLCLLTVFGCNGGDDGPTGSTETVSAPNTPTGPSSVGAGESATYTASGATSSSGHSLEYRFDWDDGNLSTWSSSTGRSHAWSSSGTYAVKAQARCATHDDVESEWSNPKSVSVTAAETVSAPNTPTGPSSVGAGESATYTASGASSNLGHSLQYQFDWGDGSLSGWISTTRASASHSWSTTGNFQVKARARCATHTDAVSNWSNPKQVSVTQEHSVSAPNTPTGDSPLCEGETGSFSTSGGTCSEGHQVNQYKFDWGDGSESSWNSGAADKSWSNSNTYCVRAKAKCSAGVESNWSGCYSVSIQECSGPVANFSGSPTTGTAPLFVQFTDLSSQGSSPITSWSWSFGDGGSSSAQNPEHEYTSEGSFTVSLTVTTAVGQDSEVKPSYITVEGQPECYVSESNLDFGDVDITNDWAELDYYIRNTGDGLLEGTVSSNDYEFQVVKGGGIYLLAHNATRNITIRFDPDNVGTRTATINNGANCEPTSCEGWCDYNSTEMYSIADAYIYYWHSWGGNGGDGDSNGVSIWNLYDGGEVDLTREVFIKFPIIGSIPGSAEINSVALKIYFYSDDWGAPLDVEIYRVASDWNESTVTWPGPGYYGTEATLHITQSNLNNGYIQMSWGGGSGLSYLVERIIDTGDNFGFKMLLPQQGYQQGFSFWAREIGDYRRPKLIIEWE